jgi:hypothetical protein
MCFEVAALAKAVGVLGKERVVNPLAYSPAGNTEPGYKFVLGVPYVPSARLS